MSKAQHHTGIRPEQGTPPASESQDQVIQGHKYDGIQEYDNPMPGWWVWIFWGTIAFSAIYVIGLHLFDAIDSYTEDLAERTEEIETVRAAYAVANPTFQVDEATLAGFVENDEAVANGLQHFKTYCAACHGNEGQGLIGPNLVDEFWIHGGSSVEIFNVISDGVATAGMPAWNNALTPEQRAELVAFVTSIQGTNPPGAKEPQGEKVESR